MDDNFQATPKSSGKLSSEARAATTSNHFCSRFQCPVASCVTSVTNCQDFFELVHSDQAKAFIWIRWKKNEKARAALLTYLSKAKVKSVITVPQTKFG